MLAACSRVCRHVTHAHVVSSEADPTLTHIYLHVHRPTVASSLIPLGSLSTDGFPNRHSLENLANVVADLEKLLELCVLYSYHGKVNRATAPSATFLGNPNADKL